MGAAEARRRMHPSCVMVLAGSVLQGEAILNGMDTAPRWDGVQMTDRHGVETEDAVVPFLGQGMNAAFEDCVVLAYRAAATRKGAAYAALCSSTWVRQAEGWQLIQHQQTPEG